MALVDFCREGRQESGCFRKCYETSAIWFGLSTMNKINPMIEQILVQRCRNNSEYSARYFCQRKAEEGGDAGCIVD